MPRRRPRLACAAAVAGLLAAATARAHIVYGRPTLMGLVAGAERVALVQIVDPAASAVLEETGERRPVIEAKLRAALKGGGTPGETLRFATHGHGVAEYQPAEEAIVFLVPLERSRELAALRAGGLRWVSFQEHDARYGVTPGNRERLLGAVRGYVAAEEMGEPRARLDQLRRVTLGLIASGDERLAAGAVQDLALAGTLPLVTAEDVPLLLERVVSSPAAPIGVRLGLLAELDRRGLVEAPPLWLALLRDTPLPDRLQVVRVAGRQPHPAVERALLELLGADDPELVAGAALALGDPLHAAATPALARALSHREPRVRRAAIRALAAIGTPGARAALSAAADHADPDTRRRAAAALQTLTR
jgi:hypothetical protein